jgi:hypothetical protein
LDERLTNDMVKRVDFRLKHLFTIRYVLNEDVKKGMMWYTSTRVVATKKGFRGHTITMSDSSLASGAYIWF